MGAWIEIHRYRDADGAVAVAPLVGAWIEIAWFRRLSQAFGSLPSWERGLKSFGLSLIRSASVSLPSWERGLKFNMKDSAKGKNGVAPLVGAWIEIFSVNTALLIDICRSPRGSVD